MFTFKTILNMYVLVNAGNWQRIDGTKWVQVIWCGITFNMDVKYQFNCIWWVTLLLKIQSFEQQMTQINIMELDISSLLSDIYNSKIIMVNLRKNTWMIHGIILIKFYSL